MNKIIADGAKQDDIVTLKQISNAVNRGPAKKNSKLDPIGWDDRKGCYEAVCKVIK